MTLATTALARSQTPRATYSTARAAFEAAQDLAFLAYSSDPAFAGARAYVAGIVDNRTTQQRGRLATAEIFGSRPLKVSEHAEDDAVQAEAAFLDTMVPTAGQILWDALAAVRNARGGRRSHWSGLRRDELIKEVDSFLRARGHTGVAATMTSMYDLLSRQTHAAPRCHEPFMRFDAGRLKFVVTPDVGELEMIREPALGCANWAVHSTLILAPEIERVLP
jgi:hypothetical protein